jgi:hypothetical protein
LNDPLPPPFPVDALSGLILYVHDTGGGCGVGLGDGLGDGVGTGDGLGTGAGAAASCVIANGWSAMVTVAVRAALVVFRSMVIETVPLPEPLLVSR